jgi:hypothetical protein
MTAGVDFSKGAGHGLHPIFGPIKRGLIERVVKCKPGVEQSTLDRL